MKGKKQMRPAKLAVLLLALLWACAPASAQSAQDQGIPGQNELTQGVTAAMFPAPPAAATRSTTPVAGPTFAQTMEWFVNTRGNWLEENSDLYGFTGMVFPDSTCSKFGLATVEWHRSNVGLEILAVSWMFADLANLDASSVVEADQTTEHGLSYYSVNFNSAGFQSEIAVYAGRGSSIIKNFKKGKTLKVTMVSQVNPNSAYQIYFGSHAYATSFAHALQHAVLVCGGTQGVSF